jgi:drug/metabolite transporter (DMT)-like permease
MRILAAYIGIVLLWSTTPLAIKWSGEGPGYLFGVTARMSIGLACVLPALAVLRQPLPLHRQARLAYLAGATQIFGSMLATYWSSQFIPSGWISVVFGLTPLLTALLAAAWLKERALTPQRLLAYALGLGGLAVMFDSALTFGPGAGQGVGGVLLASFLQAACSVWVKRIDARLPTLALLGGSLSLSVPAYLAVWFWADGQWPASLPLPSLASILYLGTVATTLGFALYFYILKHLPATRVALITLMTPVLSLWVGHAANGEPVGWRVAAGTALILGALLLHEARLPAGRRGTLRWAPESADRSRPAAALARFQPLKNRGRSSPGSVP